MCKQLRCNQPGRDSSLWAGREGLGCNGVRKQLRCHQPGEGSNQRGVTAECASSYSAIDSCYRMGATRTKKGPQAATSMQPFCSWGQMQRSCVRTPFSSSSSLCQHAAACACAVGPRPYPTRTLPVQLKKLEAFSRPTPHAACAVACVCSRVQVCCSLACWETSSGAAGVRVQWPPSCSVEACC